MGAPASFTPVTSESRHGGSQDLYRFDNGYGASVVCNHYSYGGLEGLKELGVIVWDGDDFDLTYETPITDDVVGYLTDSEVGELLAQIEALPTRAA